MKEEPIATLNMSAGLVLTVTIFYFFTSPVTSSSILSETQTTPSAISNPLSKSVETNVLPRPSEIYLSPTGDDRNPGTSTKPIASLEKARALLRLQSSNLSRSVIFLPGDYYLEKTFTLEKEDSGTEDHPVNYRSAQPHTVRIIGGKPIPKHFITPLQDPQILSRLPQAARSNVVAIPLDYLHLPSMKRLPPTFMGNGTLFSLYEKGKLLPISRWPNENFATMATVIDSGIKPEPHGGTFQFREDHPISWTDVPKNEGWWIEGYWRVPWIMNGIQVESISRSQRTITLASSIPQGLGSKYSAEVNGTRKGDGHERYRARNLIEEIDEPGEWVFRFTDYTIYLWPKEKENLSLVLVYQDEPIIHFQEAHDIHLESLTIEGGKNSTLQIDSGDRISILGCEICNGPGEGIIVKNGTDHEIISCDIHDTGGFGIRINGGDRETLTSGNLKVINNHIYHYGLINRNVSGIDILGVGHLIAHNLFHDSPYGGILYGGNNHLIEYNEVHNIGLEGGDLGGTYTSSDWTSWGNIVRFNLIHHAIAANGSYLDDGDCGDEVYGNIYYKLACGPFMGGGSHNKIHGNYVIECEKGIHLDDRGVSRKYGDSGSSYFKKASSLHILDEPWSTQYPVLATWFQQKEINLGRPSDDEIFHNVIVKCKTPMDIAASKENRDLLKIDDNIILENDPGFTSPDKLDFTFSDQRDMLTFPKGGPVAQPTPLLKIGLYIDQWRTELPSDKSTGRSLAIPPTYHFDSKTDLNQTNKNTSQSKTSSAQP